MYEDFDIMKATKKDLLALENFEPTETFNQIVVVPTNHKHESGWGCMKFVLLKSDSVVGVVGGHSDIIHFNGIGGFGEYPDDFNLSLKTHKTDVFAWKIDCLPKSKCLRIWCSGHKNFKIEGLVCSDFEFVVSKGE